MSNNRHDDPVRSGGYDLTPIADRHRNEESETDNNSRADANTNPPKKKPTGVPEGAGITGGTQEKTRTGTDEAAEQSQRGIGGR